jgi:hypothetical protein
VWAASTSTQLTSCKKERGLSLYLADLLLPTETILICCIPGLTLVLVYTCHLPQQDLPSEEAAERELDMDSLNNATLWKLKAYVDGVLTATTGAAIWTFGIRRHLTFRSYVLFCWWAVEGIRGRPAHTAVRDARVGHCSQIRQYSCTGHSIFQHHTLLS